MGNDIESSVLYLLEPSDSTGHDQADCPANPATTTAEIVGGLTRELRREWIKRAVVLGLLALGGTAAAYGAFQRSIASSRTRDTAMPLLMPPLRIEGHAQ
jgi:hypothetical protein